MKGAPKRAEKVNPTDTRPKIVVETVNSPDVLVEEVPFDAVETPQAAATTATTTTAHVEGADDEVPVCLTPRRSARGRKQRQQGVLQKRRA
jgi:hypothetical protein